MKFIDNHVYAIPGSKIYHRVIQLFTSDPPVFKCNGDQAIHDLMSTRLTSGMSKSRDMYGHRLCRKCFPL